jgi:hypothetical protein
MTARLATALLLAVAALCGLADAAPAHEDTELSSRRRHVRVIRAPDQPQRSSDWTAELFWVTFYRSAHAGLFGPASAPRRGRARRVSYAPADAGAVHLTGLCVQQSQELKQWPVSAVAETLQPNEEQRPRLEQLRDVAARTAAKLENDCSTAADSGLTQRLDLIIARLQAMLTAVEAVLRPLREVYESLDTAQRARFASVGSANERLPRDAAAQGRASAICHAMLPARPVGDSVQRLARATRPDRQQVAGLDKLMGASVHANELLRQSCALDRSGSPLDHLGTMQKRLQAAIEGASARRDALLGYYEQLDERQKERFAQLGYASALAASMPARNREPGPTSPQRR